MRAQFQILLFIVCLNLASGLVIELQLPGTERVESPYKPSNVTGYPTHFNATEVADAWESTPFLGIPLVGDIFSGFQFLFRNLQYLFVGFPMFLAWAGDTFIIDRSAFDTYQTIVAVLYALFSVTMAIFAIEFISGRLMTE